MRADQSWTLSLLLLSSLKAGLFQQLNQPGGPEADVSPGLKSDHGTDLSCQQRRYGVLEVQLALQTSRLPRFPWPASEIAAHAYSSAYSVMKSTARSALPIPQLLCVAASDAAQWQQQREDLLAFIKAEDLRRAHAAQEVVRCDDYSAAQRSRRASNMGQTV